ncbi:hypothetical protein JTE90_005926 [Oedothorax gibbosus]|uniref:Secreted protein n=1 Tax=Oedothorax gibbosus TaxID=931172 RepID=A0AAV6U958_9ARAC|nr:hypothetical protein JTE90_005926 [Oedothorax gibbosus]
MCHIIQGMHQILHAFLVLSPLLRHLMYSVRFFIGCDKAVSCFTSVKINFLSPKRFNLLPVHAPPQGGGGLQEGVPAQEGILQRKWIRQDGPEPVQR